VLRSDCHRFQLCATLPWAPAQKSVKWDMTTIKWNVGLHGHYFPREVRNVARPSLLGRSCHPTRLLKRLQIQFGPGPPASITAKEAFRPAYLLHSKAVHIQTAQCPLLPASRLQIDQNLLQKPHPSKGHAHQALPGSSLHSLRTRFHPYESANPERIHQTILRSGSCGLL
jgi:hypothetical protein